MNIALRNVVKTYSTRRGPSHVLKGVDLDVLPGERVGILGQNGAGKSTLIRILSGTERPTEGSVHRGMSVSWPLAFGGAFLGSLTGLDNIRFVCRLYGVDFRSKMSFVEEFSELGKYLGEPVKSYSSGMQARLAFAVSMAIDFDCYLIDEIVAVGDARFQRKCEIELFEKRGDRAMIFVSHSADFIRNHCHRASVLSGGILHHFSNVDQAYEYYGSHELPMQAHMRADRAEEAVRLPANALAHFRTRLEAASSSQDAEASLLEERLQHVPILESSDLVRQFVERGEGHHAGTMAAFLARHRPEESTAWLTLGDLRSSQRLHVQAVTAYEEALALDLSSYWARRNLALEFYRAGRYSEAVDGLRRVISYGLGGEDQLRLEMAYADCLVMLEQEAEYRPVGAIAPGVQLLERTAAASDDGYIRLHIGGIDDRLSRPNLRCEFIVGAETIHAAKGRANRPIERFASLNRRKSVAFTAYARVVGATEARFQLLVGDDLIEEGVLPFHWYPAASNSEIDMLQAILLAEDATISAATSLGLASDPLLEISDPTHQAGALLNAPWSADALDVLERGKSRTSIDAPGYPLLQDLLQGEYARERAAGWQQIAASSLDGGSVRSLVTGGGADHPNSGEVQSIDRDDQAGISPLSIGTRLYGLEVSGQPESREQVEQLSASAPMVHVTSTFDGSGSLEETPRDQTPPGRGAEVHMHVHVADQKAASPSAQRQDGAPALATEDAEGVLLCSVLRAVPRLLRGYARPLLVTSANRVLHWPIGDIQRHVGDADVGFDRRQLLDWFPWRRIPTRLLYFAPSEKGIAAAERIASFISSGLSQRPGVPPSIVARFALWHGFVRTVEGARVVHLPADMMLAHGQQRAVTSA